MITKELNLFIFIAQSELSYNEENKKQFLSLGKKVAQAIAEKLGLAKGSYDIRVNPGGIAVSGEVTLHAERIYIQLGQSSLGPKFMWRLCRGRKDYTGGPNQWMHWDSLKNFDKACCLFKYYLDNYNQNS